MHRPPAGAGVCGAVVVGHDGRIGSKNVIAPSTGPSSSAAGAISGVWNAPPTASDRVRLMPTPLAAAALQRGLGVPPTTIWPGAFRLAGQASPSAGCAGGLGLVGVGAEEGEHAAGAGVGGALRRLGSCRSHPHAVVERRPRRWRSTP